jgi:hypothetical protein
MTTEIDDDMRKIIEEPYSKRAMRHWKNSGSTDFKSFEGTSVFILVLLSIVEPLLARICMVNSCPC